MAHKKKKGSYSATTTEETHHPCMRKCAQRVVLFSY